MGTDAENAVILENLIAESGSLLKKILHNINDVFFLIDQDERILYANDMPFGSESSASIIDEPVRKILYQGEDKNNSSDNPPPASAS